MRVILPGDMEGIYNLHLEGIDAAMETVYIPKPKDVVIGKIIAEKKNVAYIVDISSFYAMSIMIRGLEIKLNVGDYVIGVVSQSGETLENIRLLRNGVIYRVPESKVGRIVGSKGEMLKLIEKLSNSKLEVGRNGVIWIGKGDFSRAIDIINTIVRRAHIRGLTDYIMKNFGDSR
ncbi:MAG: KH domain-containing protein [Candidatus Anstonellales archaeon]